MRLPTGAAVALLVLGFLGWYGGYAKDVHGELRCEGDGVPWGAYPRLSGAVDEGDEVIVNVQARELGLGSGGFGVRYVNLRRGRELRGEPDAHVMKLP